MKLLLYCTKSKPTLYHVLGKYITTEYMGKDFMIDGIKEPKLNGKIVAEYDYEIKNLHIFDKPRELTELDKDYSVDKDGIIMSSMLMKAPQNMMYCYEEGEKKVLISIRPEWLCKILNGEKTIEDYEASFKGDVK